MRSENLKYLLI